MVLELIRADQNFLRMHFEKILLICNKLKLKLLNKEEVFNLWAMAQQWATVFFLVGHGA